MSSLIASTSDHEYSDEQRDAAEEIVRLRTLLADAENAGVDTDDPAVAALRERVEILSTEANLVDTSPTERLDEEFDISPSTVDHLGETKQRQLLDHLEELEQLEAMGEDSRYARTATERKIDQINDLVGESVAAALSEGDTSGEKTPFEAALMSPDPDVSVNPDATPPVAVAHLSERLNEIEDDLATADSRVEEIQLQRRRDNLADRIEGLKNDA